MGAKSSRLILSGAFLLGTLAVGLQAGRIALFAFAPIAVGSQVKAIIKTQKGKGPAEIPNPLTPKATPSKSRIFVWPGPPPRQWKKIKAGEYEVSPAMSPIEIFGVI